MSHESEWETVQAKDLRVGDWTPKWGQISRIEPMGDNPDVLQFWFSAQHKPETIQSKDSTMMRIVDRLKDRTYDEMRNRFWALCRGEK